MLALHPDGSASRVSHSLSVDPVSSPPVPPSGGGALPPAVVVVVVVVVVGGAVGPPDGPPPPLGPLALARAKQQTNRMQNFIFSQQVMRTKCPVFSKTYLSFILSRVGKLL